MIRVSVLYPATEGARFDHEYYATKHMPLVAEKLGPDLVRCEFDRCLDGGDGAGNPPYLAIAHLFFESMDTFQSAMAERGGPVMADVPNYTDLAPQLLVSETHEVS